MNSKSNARKIQSVNFLCIVFLMIATQVYGQSKEYTDQKNEKLKVPSPFEAIIAGNEKDKLIYQDEFVVAFVPLRKQAPLHLLIVPKKRIPTLNDIQEDDVIVMGRMMLAAKKLAKQFGVDETGYRLSINTNENAGQSVFHIHAHLLGGMPLGPIVPQTYKE